jgi:outer membrane murein-binding lipoprotein Lpp
MSENQKRLTKYQRNKKTLNEISVDLLRSSAKDTIKDAHKKANTYKLFLVLGEELEQAIDKKNAVKAKEVLKKIWKDIPVEFQEGRIKDYELADYFNKVSKNKEFATALKNAGKAAAGALEYLDTVEKTREALVSLTKYYYTEKKTTFNTTVSKLEAARAKLEDDYEKMNVFLKFIAIINTFSPPGAKEMIEQDFKVFEEAGKTIKKVRNHAAKIEKMSSALDDLNKNISAYEKRFNEVLSW